jgi:hypothetical protein
MTYLSTTFAHEPQFVANSLSPSTNTANTWETVNFGYISTIFFVISKIICDHTIGCHHDDLPNDASENYGHRLSSNQVFRKRLVQRNRSFI